MASTSTKIGHGLARALGIKLDYRNELSADKITRGESVFSVSSADSYVEEEPTVGEWLYSMTPSFGDMGRYLYSLFPFTHWLPFYNLQWLAGDLVAGITIGAVVVPQGMAYAKLAELPVQYGLYSSFMGVLIYWLFATSKDITIGPVAVMSTITGNIVLDAAAIRPDIPGHVIASALAVIAGCIILFIGLTRLGWLVNFISLASVAAFMTGSAINIAVGQIPTMMGIGGFSTRDSTYIVVIHILQHIGRSDLNAAFGLTALAMLYIIRAVFNQCAKRFPEHRKLFFFLNTLRTVFVILLYTLISWLVDRNLPDHNSKKSHYAILGTVPRGFQIHGAPQVTTDIIGLFANQLPAAVIVLLIEHISIARSFGRVNNYTINPSQELVAIGVTNVLAPFLGGYPSTGSFSRTAIKAKAGVRTPLAGLITACVVVIAIYGLTAVFFYIPSATLSAVIIHAVGDLITPPNTVYQFWKVSPLDAVIFFAGVVVTVFTTIEIGIYTTVATSFALLVWRMFLAQGRFLGRVTVHSVVGDHVVDGHEQKNGSTVKSNEKNPTNMRNIYVPIDHGDGSNPNIEIKSPYPGIFIYRFSEGFNYPNADHYMDYLVEHIFQTTRRTNPNSYGKLGDRPWNDPGETRSGKIIDPNFDSKSTLKAIILDFSSVNNVDITSVQHLIDVRNQLDRYASPEPVQWHFACINNRWTKRALTAAGFGYPTPTSNGEVHRWKPLFSVAEIGGSSSAAADAEYSLNKKTTRDVEDGRHRSQDDADQIATSESSSTNSIEHEIQKSKAYASGAKEANVKVAVVHGLNRPLFHMDLTSALQSAIANIKNTRGQAEHDEPEGVLSAMNYTQ